MDPSMVQPYTDKRGCKSPYIGITGMEDHRTRRVAQIMGNGPIHVEAVRAGHPYEWIAER